MATRVNYPVEIKMKAIEMRLAGIPVKVAMEELNIKNYSQLKNWMKWHRERGTQSLVESDKNNTVTIRN